MNEWITRRLIRLWWWWWWWWWPRLPALLVEWVQAANRHIQRNVVIGETVCIQGLTWELGIDEMRILTTLHQLVLAGVLQVYFEYEPKGQDMWPAGIRFRYVKREDKLGFRSMPPPPFVDPLK